MKILKENFVEDTPKAIVTQLPKGTQCIFEYMSLASMASSILSELGRPVSKVETIPYDGSTHYAIVVEGTSDPRQVMDLLMSHGCLIL